MLGFGENSRKLLVNVSTEKKRCHNSFERTCHDCVVESRSVCSYEIEKFNVNSEFHVICLDGAPNRSDNGYHFKKRDIDGCFR